MALVKKRPRCMGYCARILPGKERSLAGTTATATTMHLPGCGSNRKKTIGNVKLVGMGGTC